MRLAVFPFGAHYKPAPDWLGHKAVELVLVPGEVRDRLTRYIFVSNDPNDPTGALELAFTKAVAAEAVEKKLNRAIREGRVQRVHGTDWFGEAVKQGIITAAEGDHRHDRGDADDHPEHCQKRAQLVDAERFESEPHGAGDSIEM